MWSYSHIDEKFKEIEVNNQVANSGFPINTNGEETIVDLFFKFFNPEVINFLVNASNEYIIHLLEKKDKNFRHKEHKANSYEYLYLKQNITHVDIL